MDLSFVEGVAREIAVHIDDYKIVVDKSTVPVKTGEKVAQTIAARKARPRTSTWSAIPNSCAKVPPSKT